MPNGLRLNLIDGCSVETQDGSKLALNNKKSLAVLGYLSTCTTNAASRSRLCGLFWSEFEETRSRTSLRQSLKLINKALHKSALPALVSDKDQIQLPRNVLSLDLQDVWDAVASENYSFPALMTERLPERVFVGFEDLDPAFDTWMAIFREELRQKLLTQLEARFHGTDDIAKRLWIARALVRAEPTDEAMVRFIMETETSQGRTTAALREFDALRQTLRVEFDVGVEPVTRDLAELISGKREKPARSLETGSAPPVPAFEFGQDPTISVSVRVADGRTNDRMNALATFFQTALISGLVRFRHWTIVENAATNNYAEVPATTHELRIILNRAVQSLNVSIELKENAYLQHVIWAETISLAREAWEEKVAEVVKGLCGAFNIHLSRYHLERVRKGQRVDPPAFDKLVEGQTLLQLWSPEADERAEALFLEAIHISPDNAELHARLADIYNSRHIIYPGAVRSAELELKSLQLAKRAVMLDPLSAKCHLTLAWSQAMAGKHSQAIFSFQTSAELNDADPENLISAAHGAAICGNAQLAARCRDLAFKVHPRPPNLYWGFDSNIRYQAGEYDLSVQSADRSGEIKPNILGWKCAALGMLGRTAEAAATAHEFVSLVRQNWAGPAPPSTEQVVDWFVQIFPFGEEAQKRHLLEGLVRASLPGRHLKD